jgi:hypothetical protein
MNVRASKVALFVLCIANNFTNTDAPTKVNTPNDI